MSAIGAETALSGRDTPERGVLLLWMIFTGLSIFAVFLLWRYGLIHLMVVSDRMKELVQTKARTGELLALAREEGMRTLLQDGIEKVAQGLTTYQQVRAVAIK